MKSEYHPEMSAHLMEQLRYAVKHNDVDERRMVLEAWQKAMGTPEGHAEKRLHLELGIMLARMDDGVYFPGLEKLIHDADIVWASSVSSRLSRSTGKPRRVKQARADAVGAWLHPMLETAWEALSKDYKRPGRERLLRYVKTRLLPPDDDRAKLVTDRRIRNWVEAKNARN